MKYFLTIISIFTLSSSSFAGHSFGLDFESNSTTVDGKSKTDNTEGIIVSPGNMNYKFLYTWSMSQNFHFNFNLGQKKYKFVDDDGIISNDEEFTASTYDLGIKFIFASWGAVSLIQVSDFDAAFSVVDSNKIKIEAENISYLRFVYHQLLFNLRSMIFAVDINYDLSGSNSFINNRSAVGFKGYVKFNNNGWGMNLFLSQQNITKDSDDKDFKHIDTSIGSSFYMFF